MCCIRTYQYWCCCCLFAIYIVCMYVHISYRFIWHSQWRTGNQLLMLFTYKDSSIELNVINMRIQASWGGRREMGGGVKKEKYLSLRMLRISICFLRSINKHEYTKPQKRQHVCGWKTNGKPTRKLHLSSSVLFVVSRNERYRHRQ